MQISVKYSEVKQIVRYRSVTYMLLFNVEFHNFSHIDSTHSRVNIINGVTKGPEFTQAQLSMEE